MYQTSVTTREQALSHLFFHCCLKDAEYTSEELNALSEKMVVVGLDSDLNFTAEIENYKSYFESVKTDDAYVKYLVQLIQPINNLALYSYCIELCISDGLLAAGEETLLEKIGAALDINEDSRQTIAKLIVQRNVVETGQLL